MATSPNIQYPADIRIASLTGDSFFMMADTKVQKQTLYYSFDIADSAKYYPTGTNVARVTDSYQEMTRNVFRQAELITGIKFVEVATSATAEYHIIGSDTVEDNRDAISHKFNAGGGYVVVSNDAMQNKPWWGQYIPFHEIGHTLGLSHPHDIPAHTLPKDQDNLTNTVMTYNVSMAGFAAVDGFQDYDIRALFYIWGGDGPGGDFGYNSVNGQIVLDNIYRGEAGKNIIGSAGVDWMLAGAGNSMLNGGAGSDFMIGSNSTITTSFYESVRSKYTVTVKTHTTDSLRVTVDAKTTGEGVDTLREVQRLHFSDVNVALDTQATQHAGEAALLVGSVLGVSALSKEPGTVGAVLAMLDSGTTMQELCSIVAKMPELATRAGGSDNQHIASYLLTNAMGHAPDAKLLGAADQYIKDVGMDNLLYYVTMHDVNQAHVDLVGLDTTGLVFV